MEEFKGKNNYFDKDMVLDKVANMRLKYLESQQSNNMNRLK